MPTLQLLVFKRRESAVMHKYGCKLLFSHHDGALFWCIGCALVIVLQFSAQSGGKTILI
jgi:hypothetical protein